MAGTRRVNGNSVMQNKSPRRKIRKVDCNNQSDEINQFSDIVVTATTGDQIQDMVQVGLSPNEELEFEMELNDANLDFNGQSSPSGDCNEMVTTSRNLSPVPTSDVVDDDISFKKQDGNNINFNQLAANPAFQNYVQNLVAKQVREEKSKKKDNMPKKGTDNGVELLKFPLDTTLYAPGLKQITNRENQTPLKKIDGTGLNQNIN